MRRKVAGHRTSWSLAIFDEAHRLTPTSQYLTAAREVAGRSHHLLLLTATPHRGKERYFRGLMNLLDPTLYPWDPRQSDYETALVPSKLSFLRRMKEDLVDHDANPLFPPRFSETVSVPLNPFEAGAYDAVMAYVDAFYDENAVLARSIYGKRAASSRAIRGHLRRRGITATIPEPADQKANRARRGSRGGRPPGFDAERYKQRNTVERCLNKLKGHRAVATRYDKRDYIYRGTIDVASIRIWLRDPVHDPSDTP